MGKGKSSAVLRAMKYLAKHPSASGSELAILCGIDKSTVYRSDWWKNRPAAAAQPQTGEK